MQTTSRPLIVITGASSGIGAATARAFSAAGHPLLLISRRLEPMLELGLPNAMCCAVDVLQAGDFEKALCGAEATYGPADCLVNNAGVMMNAPLVEGDPAQWDQMIDINIKGVLNGIRSVLKSMVARESGTIVNIGSIAGVKTFGAHAVYCGTKFAVHAITETVREEVSGKNVRLITIAPGMVETELVNHTTHDAAREGWWSYARQIGGALKPESIAQAILWSYQMPQSVCVREMIICPTKQEP
jgi:NADP-dependent 3-hydroxy acid dehydrogenase YdfG